VLNASEGGNLNTTGDVNVTTANIQGAVSARDAILTAQTGSISGLFSVDADTATLSAGGSINGVVTVRDFLTLASLGGTLTGSIGGDIESPISPRKLSVTGTFLFNGKPLIASDVTSSQLDPFIFAGSQFNYGVDTGPATSPAQAVFGANITQRAFVPNVFAVDFTLFALEESLEQQESLLPLYDYDQYSQK
jgi:hypothetical protein